MAGKAKTGLRRDGSSQSTETKGTESEGMGSETPLSEDLESVRALSTRSQSEGQGAVEIFWRAEGPESEWRHPAKDRTPNHLNRNDRKAHERIGNRRGTKERNATMRNRRHRSASQWSPKQGSVPMIAIRTPVWAKRPEPRGADHERASSERPRSACSSSAPQTRTKKRNPNGTLVCPIIGVFGPNNRRADRLFAKPANFRTRRRPIVGTSGIYLAQEYHAVALRGTRRHSRQKTEPRS